MTRRKSKQLDDAWYVTDGNAGEVWVAWGHDPDPDASPYAPDIMLDVFANEQIANQFAEVWAKQNGMYSAPKATKRVIRTKMKDINR